MKKKLLHFSLCLIRGAVLSAFGAFMTDLWGALFISVVSSKLVAVILSILMSALIYRSCSTTLHRHDKYIGNHSPKHGDKAVNFAKLILCSLDFYIELCLISAGAVLYPAPGPFTFIDLLLFGGEDKKLRTLLIMLPILFCVDFFAWRRMWLVKRSHGKKFNGGMVTGKKERKKILPPVVWSTVRTFSLYFGAVVSLVFIIHFTLPFFTEVDFPRKIFIAILIFLVIFYISLFLRAILKRRKFVKSLQKYCGDNMISLSKVRRPYASLFLQRSGYDFTVEKDGNVWECKFVSAILPWTPILFSATGGMRLHTVRIFRIEVLSIQTNLDYTWESENKKIIVALPVPRKIYKYVKGFQPKEADTAEVVGDYTVYNASGFLGALDRDCL